MGQRDQGDDAASLYERGVQLSHEKGRGEEAERVLGAAVAAYRRLQRSGDDPEAVRARRGLARALWRHSMQLDVLGRRTEAMAPGREGVALFREVLDDAPPDDAASDELVGELGTAMNDLSQVAVGAEFRHEHQALMRDVVELCEGRPGPLARQALGTTTRQWPTPTACSAFGGASPPPADYVSAVIDLANRTVELRSELADLARPMTVWELANSRRQRGVVLCSAAMGERGIADLLAAWDIASRLITGASVEDLRSEVSEAMYWAAARYLHVAASVDWPALPGEMDDDDFALFANSAIQEFFEKNNSLKTKYEFKGPVLWMYDRDAATLKFFDNGKLHSTCDVIEMGSFSRSTQTWRWGWSSDSTLRGLRERALPLKKLQQITGRKYFGSEDPFPADEIMAGKLAAISLRHLSALGQYSAPTSDGCSAFLALVNIHIETARYSDVATSLDSPVLPGEMDDNDFALFADSAVKELDQKLKSLETRYKFDLSARWSVDLGAATLKFFDQNDKLHLTCDVIEIGSYAPPTQTWKWGWSNDSVPPKMREQALPLKQLQRIAGKDYFGSEDPFSADEVMARQLAAISVRHLSALGCYRARIHDGRLFVFLAYVNIHVET